MKYRFFDRDISWLAFNGRVLQEAARTEVPLAERFRFLAIYSSNLDEFYRVRIPALLALHRAGDRKKKSAELLSRVQDVIEAQQAYFGRILTGELLAALELRGVRLLYNKPLPEVLRPRAELYFLREVAGFLQRVYVEGKRQDVFFPENNRIYFLVSFASGGQRAIINIPSDALSRFVRLEDAGGTYIVLLDDIIRESLHRIFPARTVTGCWSFKVTRDAELNLADEYGGDIAERIERQVAKRDQGLATRVLYDQGFPPAELDILLKALGLKKAVVVEGGRYHNLRDLEQLPLKGSGCYYPAWPGLEYAVADSVFRRMEQGDFMIHVPYQNYDTVLRFFNEASLDEEVSDIYITLYRVASDSRIVQALISAARNGKKVMVFVELLARFDEANNLRWAKKMKAAGVKLIYSIPGMKVHAKMVLVKRRARGRDTYYGLLSTGNLNERTARFYTDHVLFTTSRSLVREMELLFLFLRKGKKPDDKAEKILFEHLLVAPFNLLERLRGLIRFEAAEAREGRPASIVLKLNNLEEKTLITELYRASGAGVEIRLIIRGICRLIPGVPGMSDHITVTRIVDRYLEHGRVCIFHHGGAEKMLMGSADWMERNMLRRIEVCFPVYDTRIRAQVNRMISIGLADNVQAVKVNDKLENVPLPARGKRVCSQAAIYESFKKDDDV